MWIMYKTDAAETNIRSTIPIAPLKNRGMEIIIDTEDRQLIELPNEPDQSWGILCSRLLQIF